MEVALRLAVAVDEGLTEADVLARRAASGPNELSGAATRTLGTILVEQALSPMVLMLLAAAGVKGAVALLGGASREWIDTVAILAIVILNVILGVV